jgi:hypothetical protein
MPEPRKSWFARWRIRAAALVAAALSMAASATAAVPAAVPAAVDSVVVLTAYHQPGTESFLARTAYYTVRPGDTLSGIATKLCGKNVWSGLYAANRGVIGGSPDRIFPGQRFRVACYAAVTAATARHASTGQGGRIRGVTYGYPNYCGDGDGDGWDVACQQAAPARAYSQARSSGGGYSGPSGSYEACVIARESGGNSQVMNSSGHYGLYQFSSSTWQAYGGSASSFGHASAAEQQRVFRNAIRQGGQSNWSPYDGC